METVLVTGGSNGIGLEIAKLFADRGDRILIVALPGDELDAAAKTIQSVNAGVDVHTLGLDLTQASSAGEVVEWTQANGWAVDILCNNAGIGLFGDFLEEPEALVDKMVDLNVKATIAMTRAFLPSMRARNKGRIMIMSSVTALSAVPPHTTYAATKAFTDSLARSLYYTEKNRRSNITVTSVCPSAVRNTGFQGTQKVNVEVFKTGVATTTPEEVAKDAVAGTLAGKKRVYTGAKHRLLRRLGLRFLPEGMLMPLIFKELKPADRGAS